MKSGMKWVAALLAVTMVLAAAEVCMAAGFSINEASSRANSLGWSMTGRADDPSALFFNPAGITQLEGTHLMAGTSVIVPNVDVETTDIYSGSSTTTSSKDVAWVVPHGYGTFQLNDWAWLGVAGFSRFGLGTEFDEDWVGRYNNYKAHVQTYSLNPNVAFKVWDGLSLSAGVEVMYIDVDLRSKVDGEALLTAAGVQGLQPFNPSTTAFDNDQRISGHNVGVGYNLGVHWKINDEWRVGLAYRSEVEQNIKGSMNFELSAASDAAGLRALMSDTDVKTTLRLPAVWNAGIAYDPFEELSIEVGATYTQWSSYKAINLYPSSPVYGSTDLTNDKRWKDVWRFNIGAEYSPMEELDLRLGYVYDESPIRDGYEDYSLPSNDRHIVSTGAAYNLDNWKFDVSYMYLMIVDRDCDSRQLQDGFLETKIKNGNSHIFGLSVSYAF